MPSLFLHALPAWKPLAYALVFLGMIFEGDVLLFMAGFLTHEGYFEAAPILGTLMSGVLLGDFFWYTLGRTEKWHPKFLTKLINRIASRFDHKIQRYPSRIILITKFIYGIHRAILIRCGMLKISRKKFIRADLAAASLWIALIGGIGYMASSSLLRAKHLIKYSEIGLGLALVIYLLAERLITKHLKRKLEEPENKEEQKKTLP